jgi:hypothetical protein
MKLVEEMRLLKDGISTFSCSYVELSIRFFRKEELGVLKILKAGKNVKGIGEVWLNCLDKGPI